MDNSLNENKEFSEVVSMLLSTENKDKSLGEVSQEMNEFLITIKEAVDSNEISYEQLREEIKKHISPDETVPGSVSQLLVGCVGEEDSCPISKEVAEDVPFVYDFKSSKIIPLSKIDRPLTKDTYCVLYITGSPEKIKFESLKEILKMGFKKLKIKYKESEENSYENLEIDDLIYFLNKEESFFEKHKGSLIVVLCLLLLLLFYLNFTSK